MSPAPDDLSRQLQAIGGEHITLAYATPLAAKRAWERAQYKIRHISMWRHAAGVDGPQAITVMGEDADLVTRAARLLSHFGGTEVECDPRTLETLRNRRRRTAVRYARDLKTGKPVREVVRFGEGGARLGEQGDIHLRRRQG